MFLWINIHIINQITNKRKREKKEKITFPFLDEKRMNDLPGDNVTA